MADRVQGQILDSLVNHITLPPRLPFRNDLQGGAVDRALAERLARHARAFRQNVDTQYYMHWSLICHALDQFVKLHGSKSGHLDKDALKNALIDFSNSNSNNDILIIHIATQNAGLIIRKENSRKYIFEAFEASPQNAEVLASKSALRWDFPSHAVAVTPEIFTDSSFQDNVARFLEQASIEQIKEFAATTSKAGSNAFESRDTASPALIGQLLMAFLEANGQAHASKSTRKRVRDDVCWDDGAENPWRRSPTWLVLRVGMQRALCLLLDGDSGTLHYKAFIAYVVAGLCEEMSEAEAIRVEYLAHTRTKLARRISKMQAKKETASPVLSANIDEMLSRFEKEFVKILEGANGRLNAEWAIIRQRSQKRVARFPIRADESSLVLSLAHSGEHLEQLCRNTLTHHQSLRSASSASYLTIYSTNTKRHEGNDLDVNYYWALAEFESEVELRSGRVLPLLAEPATHEKCSLLASAIQEYQQNALFAYNSDPEQLSLMILIILELWTSLDSMALQLFPLLSEYETGISSEILHVLQLSRLSDLRRLRAVEHHLQVRHRSANHVLPSVFGDPSKTCFEVRYFDQNTTMQDLFRKITLEGDRKRELKKIEWEAKSAEYESLLKQAAEKTCLYFERVDRFGETYLAHNNRHCEKHHLEGAAGNIRIAVHEHPLPEDENAAKAVVFELLCPAGFSAWRDTTWSILGKLGHDLQLADRAAQLLVQEYSELHCYGIREARTITLASTAKSFLRTHYRGVSFPVPFDKVCLPNGLRLGLYDQEQKSWTARQRTKPSFARHCTSSLPTKSSFSSLGAILKAVGDKTGHTANEIIASQSKCPNGLTPFEYTSFQELLLGTKLRWIQLLRELASSNINFGTPATVTLVSQLALQAGRPWGNRILRISHWVFCDETFCYGLIEQIATRLEAIKTNWRETQTLECLITLTQRLWELGSSSDVIKQAEDLFKNIRTTTLNWTRSLRQETLTAKDGKTALMRSNDALIAALLFRRTYVLEAQDSSGYLNYEALADFVECSIILYDNMPTEEPGRFSRLPLSLRNMIVRDIKIVHRLKNKLRQSILLMTSAIDCAINRVWLVAAEAPSRAFTLWESLPCPYEQWVSAYSIATDNMRSQEVHYNFLDGSFLVDHQKLGKLPKEYVNHVFFQQFLGERVHSTRPSPLPGMQYALAALIDGYQVHFGVRDGSQFVRAVRGPQVLEAIPPHVFLGPAEDSDLPMALINDHFHWLDLTNGRLLVRPKTTIWHSKESDWTLELSTGQAWRRYSRLVDVRSSIFQRLAMTFEPFEHRSQLLVYQPSKRYLSMHLQNLKLDFSINRNGLLECQQLRAIIDDNQDAGTLYGLDSKLVLRDLSNPRERSIVVAMGKIQFRRSNGHVRASSDHSQYYCRFSINTILNRLDCPPEPRVVYLKAYCHAITSFVLPDPLTGRTGTEEALHSLLSGIAQPWAPVDTEANRWLEAIAALSPRRSYYPIDSKVQQKVLWLDSLTFAAQDDRFYPVVARIIAQCRQLHRFSFDANEPPGEVFGSDHHLAQRAKARNDTYRFNASQNIEIFSDMTYSARDGVSSTRQAQAFQAATLIRRWSRKTQVTADLADILQQWPVIQGYKNAGSFQHYLLNELISIEPASNWGSLFQYCQDLSQKQDLYGAMFFFATLAFGGKVKMILVKTLIAFVIIREFQSLSVPKWESFTHFRKQAIPSVDYLVQLMAPAVIPYPEDERSLLGGISLNYKQQRALEAAQTKYDQLTKEIRQTTAKDMLRQWPCEAPSVAIPKDCRCVDLERAVALVRPEWLEFFKNHELYVHLLGVQRILDKCEPETTVLGPENEMANAELYPTFTVTNTLPTIQDIIKAADMQLRYHTSVRKSINKTEPGFSRFPYTETRNVGGNIDLAPIFLATKYVIPVKESHPELRELEDIISPFVHSEVPVRRIYGEYLDHSLVALRNVGMKQSHDTLSIDQVHLTATLTSCEAAVKSRFDLICKELNRHPSFAWLSRGGLWPNLTPVTILENLGSGSGVQLSGLLKDTTIAYGVLITIWQRLMRIEAASRIGNIAQLRELFDNEGHREWSPNDYPGWLLLEIENNILIRTDQCKVAKAMIIPESGSSSVLQMNMGQGKSSVIIPMIAAMLADKKQLFRVIVPKPLLLQMAQLLQARLGGLLGRAVKHVPFSRRSSTSKDNIMAYLDLHRESLKAQGIVLALPEHLLSFKLSGLQRLSSGAVEEAAFMMRVQSWLTSKSRDVLDECDYSLAVKTQLVYPSGAQRMVDGHPHRWKVVQAVLKLVKGTVEQLHLEFPRSIEVTAPGSSGRFPAIHFSQDRVKDALIERVTESVCRGEGGLLPINDCTNAELEAVADLLNKRRFTKEEMLKVSDLFRTRQAARQAVLILRGLLVYRILLMALTKRWNVQYGLHPRRDPVAVPYQAKGVPSEQAEFGHPDVAILLTCLSFYYSGLEEVQFEQVLRHVLKSDDPALEYDRWVLDANTLPGSVRTWAAVNVDDEIQRRDLWDHLRYNMVVIDCFLNHFVFPYHAKTFERKLVSSAWDIPLPPSYKFPPTRDSSKAQRPLEGVKEVVKSLSSITTGFSGTNDNRTLLPLNIEQRDLTGLAHTNAEVLTYLLQPRNRHYHLAADFQGRRLTEYQFLKSIHRLGIRMLLDAGAQILELDNESLVRTWLTIDCKADAAVFFDKEDKARILYKDGRSVPLVASHFNDNLGACLVYLDEAHTRGTDLKMPACTVAALTLGPSQTKDHTIQGMFVVY